MSSLCRVRWLPMLFFFFVLLVGCAGEADSQEPPEPGAQHDPDVLATVDGSPITLADLQNSVGDELATLEFQYGSQRYQVLQRGLQTVLRTRLLADEAKARGISADELIKSELEGKLEVSDEAVSEWYEQNRQRLQGRSLEMLAPAIRQFLWEQQRDRLLTDLTDRLAADRDVQILLEPFRAEIETTGHPALGPDTAPVTLVEFSDFECPFCGSFFSTLERVKRQYEGKIRLVYRQFPLRQLHPHAQKAAEASLCAAEQGHFWELHDRMFSDQSALSVQDLKDKAAELGLDAAAFAECLDSGRTAPRIEADIKAGTRLGVTGTPALFVNGRPLEGGAVPFERVAQVIDEELQRPQR